MLCFLWVKIIVKACNLKHGTIFLIALSVLCKRSDSFNGVMTAYGCGNGFAT